MDKLPTVSYIRMVDIWLITVQLLPFIFVVITTVEELLTDSTSTNHHGVIRKVGKNNQRTFGLGENTRKKMAFIFKLLGNNIILLSLKY